MSKPIIRLESLTKAYGSVYAVQQIDLTVFEGEFLTILGPSGCGKTTVLRMIAGYVTPTSGRLFLDGRDITERPPRLRNVGMVFQNYALFPHMTVAENIAFSLRIRREPEATLRRKVNEMLELVQLSGHERKRPGQLSGGQQQRVALARALAMSPRILLTDEPMAALDVKLRDQMQFELKNLQSRLGITTIHVTHDQEEALSLSDRVVVMHAGRIVQVDTPQRLYACPANRYVADFVGKINFLRGEVSESDRGGVAVRLAGGFLATVAAATPPMVPGQPVWLGVRPERCRLAPPQVGVVEVIGQVEKLKFVGSDQFATLRVEPETRLTVRDTEQRARIGDVLAVTWDAGDAMLFPDE